MTQWKQILWVGLSFIAISVTALAQSPNDIIGKWNNEAPGTSMQMEIFLATDGKYYGKTIRSKEHPAQEGKITLKALVYDQKTNQYTGSMKVPDGNMELNISLLLVNKDRIKMTGKKLLMSKTFYLARIK
jgi:uncharacterized protein (DUF2147 family)